MKTRLIGFFRNLLVTPPLMIAGLGYGLVVGSLMGIGMAILLWDKGFKMPFRLGPMKAAARAGFSGIAFLGWLVTGTAVGALMPILDRGTFVGIIKYGLPLKRHRHTDANAGQPKG